MADIFNTSSTQKLSSQIFMSRDQIRSMICEYMKDYLELENVDLTKSSFLSYLINIISTLTSNLLFYEGSIYKEFFLTKAQLPESVINLSAFLGYDIVKAVPADASVTMNVPLGFSSNSVKFQIPKYFNFYTDACSFMTTYTTYIEVTNNIDVKIEADFESYRYRIPYTYVDTTDGGPAFKFDLPVLQQKIVPDVKYIDADIKDYQFPEVMIDVDNSQQLFKTDVYVTPPDTTVPISEYIEYYTEYQSLYLIPLNERGYVSRKTQEGRRITFGNGLVGVQPTGGSKVDINSYLTYGALGNVPAGTILRGDKVYCTIDNQTFLIEYTCINTIAAENGADEESTDEIRSNAIKSLVSMDRFVSEQDYKNADVILEGTPFGSNSLAILKRSDVRCNEIQVYTTLKYQDSTNVVEIVPTINASYSEVTTTPSNRIPKYTEIISDGTSYLTMFDIKPEIMNTVAVYEYVLNSISVDPSLVNTERQSYYGIEIGKMDVSVDSTSNAAVFVLNYNAVSVDPTAACTFKIPALSVEYVMDHDPIQKTFTLTFSPYTLFPEGFVNIILDIESIETKASYEVSLTLRRDLFDTMQSNLTYDTTSSTLVIFDIPVVLTDYYRGLADKDAFESNCLQKLVNNTYFENNRMLTDFVNLKFANTFGNLVNMKYNVARKPPVIDFVFNYPIDSSTGYKYIISSDPVAELMDYKGNYLTKLSSGWKLERPSTNDVVYVIQRDQKYIFNGSSWIIPVFKIPLEIKIEAFKESSYFGSSDELKNAITTALFDNFSSRFGINIQLYRSEIIKVVQSVDGVDHCNLIEPNCDIFFDFDLKDLTQDELMLYSPEYVYFVAPTGTKSGSISIRII